MRLYYQIEVMDKDGSTVKKSRKRRAKSFVQNFLTIIAANLQNSDLPLTTTSNGASSTLVSYSEYYGQFQFPPTGGYGNTPYFNSTGVLSSSTYGIVIGSGTTTVTSTDYALTTPIVNGNSAGQLEYGPHLSDESITVSAPTASFNLSRLFRNGGSGNVVIKEIAFYAYSPPYSISSGGLFCLIHDLVSPTVTVTPGEYIKVTYNFQISTS